MPFKKTTNAMMRPGRRTARQCTQLSQCAWHISNQKILKKYNLHIKSDTQHVKNNLTKIMPQN